MGPLARRRTRSEGRPVLLLPLTWQRTRWYPMPLPRVSLRTDGASPFDFALKKQEFGITKQTPSNLASRTKSCAPRRCGFSLRTSGYVTGKPSMDEPAIRGRSHARERCRGPVQFFWPVKAGLLSEKVINALSISRGYRLEGLRNFSWNSRDWLGLWFQRQCPVRKA